MAHLCSPPVCRRARPSTTHKPKVLHLSRELGVVVAWALWPSVRVLPLCPVLRYAASDQLAAAPPRARSLLFGISGGALAPRAGAAGRGRAQARGRVRTSRSAIRLASRLLASAPYRHVHLCNDPYCGTGHPARSTSMCARNSSLGVSHPAGVPVFGIVFRAASARIPQ